MRSSIHQLAFALCALSSSGLNAQVLYQDANEMDRRGLSGTTTYVQLTGDKDYDARIKDALAEGWTVTRGIEFIEAGEPLGDPADERRSYISIWTVNTAYQPEHHLVFWQGGTTWADARDQKTGRFEDPKYWNSWVVACPIDHRGREGKDQFCAWRLPLMIGTMRQMIRYAREHKPATGREGMLAYEMKGLRSGTLRGKTLLIWNGRYSDAEIKTIRENYKHPTELVDMSVILEAMAGRDPNYAILVLVQGGKSDLVVHDAASYELLFAHHSGYSASLDPDAAKSMGKAAKKD